MSRMTASTAARTSKKDRAAEPKKAASCEYGTFEHIMLVLARLDEIYGHGSEPSGAYAAGEPLDGLILTLLSQNTNDRNRDTAYEALRGKYPKWSAAASAPREDIAAAIKSAGLGDIKAGRMKQILEEIARDFGSYSLAAMKDWDPARVRDYLSGLHGIGPKTVACVMAFDLGMPAFPVDTHVARISRRLGWAGEKSSPEKIQLFLENEVPPEQCGGGHLNMIEHGRKICHARVPECGECVLNDVCRNVQTGG